jgi:pilus assembly protein FimV
VVVAAPAPVETSLIDDLTENPLIPAGVVGGLGVLGFLGYRRWSNKKKEAQVDSSFLESRLQPDSFFGASGGQQINTGAANSQSAAGTAGSSMVYSPSQLDAAGDVDPVAEADVYLAYGRDLQAEEILKEALRVSPKRVAIHAKLLDIYAKRRDGKAFELLAREVNTLTGGTGPDWERACELGRDLDAQNPLYQPGAAAAAPVAAAAAAAGVGAAAFNSAATMPISAMERGLEDGTADVDLDLDFSMGDDEPAMDKQYDATVPVRPAQAAQAEPPSLMEMSAPSLTMPAPLSFDMDVNSYDAKAPSPSTGDLNLSLPDLTAGGNGLSFSPPPAPAAKGDGLLQFDLGGLSLDLPKPGAAAGASDDYAGTAPSVMPEELSGDPLETKLALAREFREIGDKDGARDLAREVIADATGPLKAKAEKLLKELS